MAACASHRATINDTRYDLGPPLVATAGAMGAMGAMGATPAAHALPPLKVLEVSAPSQLDNDGIVYRLGADAQRTARYAQSRWTMPPARLLTMRLRSALGAHVTVLAGADAVAAPRLAVELDQFEQVFENATHSYGVLTARATLIGNGKAIAQHVFVIRAPAASPDAAGGVGALATASDEFVEQIGAWLDGQRLAGRP